MGWDYEDRIMYGFYTKARNNENLIYFLNKNPSIVIDEQLSSGYSTFIYFKSSYKVLNEDYGSYAFGGPRDCPCFTITVTDKDLPVLTNEEQKSLDEFCSLYNELIELRWMRNAYISY
jgi:hypothetical protein